MRAKAVATPLKGSERMNVTNYYKKHGYVFVLDLETNPIAVEIITDMETAIERSKNGKILCSKTIAKLYSSETKINELLKSVKTQNSV